MTPFVDVQRTAAGAVAKGSATARFGADAVHGPGGDPHWSLTACWEWDGSTLVIRADRLGMLPLYVHVDHRRIVCSSSLARVVERMAEPAPDIPALVVFNGLGNYVGRSTPVAGVERLRPGESLRWSAGDLVRDVPASTPAALSIERGDAAREFGNLFEEAVQRRIPPNGRTGLALSGGRDSRHILCSLLRQGESPHVATVATEHNDDGAIAAALCSALGIAGHTMAPEPYQPIRDLERLMPMLNFEAPVHSWMLPLVRHFHQQVDTCFDGIGGDVLSNGLLYDARVHRLLAEGNVREVTHRYVPPLTPLSSIGTVTADQAEEARELLDAELTRYLDHPNPWSAFLLANRTRRLIAPAPFAILSRSGAEIATPFLDPELVAFLVRLPGSQYGAPGFHTEAIGRWYPEAAALGYASNRTIRHRPFPHRATVVDGLRILRHVTRRLAPPVRRARLLARLSWYLAIGRWDVLDWPAGLLVYHSLVQSLLANTDPDSLQSCFTEPGTAP